MGDADGAPRLRPLRRAGRRLGRDDLGASRGASTPSTWSACTATCCWRSPTTRAGSSSPTQEIADLAAAGEFMTDGRRVPGDPGQEPADARLRAHRFAGRARGLDRREVPRLDRQQRQPRRRGHARPDPHQPHRLLGDEDDQLVDPPLLRVAAHRPLRSDRRVRRRCPTAAAVFPKEMFRIPRGYAEIALQPRALHPFRPRRPLRRARGARPAGRKTSRSSSEELR